VRQRGLQAATTANAGLHAGRAARLLSVGLALVLACAFVGVLVDVYRVAALDTDGDADAAVVLGAAQWNGAPSPVFKARLDHAAALWRAGRARWIIVTGGTGPGDSQSEADVGARYLRARGLPDRQVLPAPGGSTTLASIHAATDLMRALGLERALLVSDPYHMKRSLRMARDVGLDAAPSPARDGPFASAPVAVLRQSAREAASFLVYVTTGW